MRHPAQLPGQRSGFLRKNREKCKNPFDKATGGMIVYESTSTHIPRCTRRVAAPGAVAACQMKRDGGKTKEETKNGSNFYEAAAGGRRTFRPSDPPLEPEDGSLHLHRA